MGFGDIMDAFFGGGGGGQRGPRARSRPGADALLRLDLDLNETAFGVEREVAVDTAILCETCDGAGTAAGTRTDTCPQCEGRGEVQTVTRSFLGQMMTTRACPRCAGSGSVIPHPCPTCSGDGRVRSRRTITVKVPAGVRDGMRIQLSGQGEVGPGGGPAGDLYIEIREREHPIFHREGDDLHCQLNLPMTAAALGTTLTLTTLDGEEPIEVRPGTQSGQVVSLSGRGTSRLQAHGRGDLHAHISVETPTKLDDEQEELLRRLAVLRNEERPDGHAASTSGLFGRLRGAFSGR
jgi:molecular chaperone DnaJ